MSKTTFQKYGEDKDTNRLFQRLKQLGGDQSQPGSNISSLYESLTDFAVSKDGKTYGIIKTQHKYYLKESQTQNSSDVSTYEYPEGFMLKEKYGFPSHASALRALVGKMESLQTPYHLIENKLVSDYKEILLEQTLPSPEKEPVPLPNPAPSPEPAVDPDAPAELGAEAPDSEFDENPVEVIQSMTGKLTQLIRTTDKTQLTPEIQKATLNSIISAIDLQSIPAEERLEIARKIKKGEDKESKAYEQGTEVDAAAPAPAPAPAPEEPSFKNESLHRTTIMVEDLIKEMRKKMVIEEQEKKKSPKKPKYNNSDYKYYVLDTKKNKIESGWEYKEDAQDRIDTDELKNVKVYSKTFLKSKGINPDEDKNWG